MRIKLGDGHKALAQGICKDVELEAGSITFTVDTFSSLI